MLERIEAGVAPGGHEAVLVEPAADPRRLVTV